MGTYFFKKKKVKVDDSPPESVRVATLIAENSKLKRLCSEVSKQNRILEDKIKKKDLVDVKMGDPAPIDSEQRKLYVSKIAGLHKEILEPKLKQMISSIHTLLEDETNPRDLDQTLKGTIYAFWEIIRWGNMMVNEQISNQMNQSQDLSNDKEQQ